MDLVKQEQVGDCGPACVAMVLGCTLAEAREQLPKHPTGWTTPSDIIECLAQHGVPAIESLVWPNYSVSAILTVPSLNHPGLLHFILWDGEQYLDPTNESKRYPDDVPTVRDQQLPPQWATVILLLPKGNR